MGRIETGSCPSLQEGGIETTPDKPYRCQRGFSIVMVGGLPAPVKPQSCGQSFPGQPPLDNQCYCVKPPVDASQDVIVPAGESLLGLFDGNNTDDSIAWE